MKGLNTTYCKCT